MYLFVKLIAHISSFFFRTFGFGSGNTWPGHLARKLYPGVLETLHKHLPEKIVLITGTNGKTTTAKLVTHLLEKSGKSVVHNSSGANLLNGIVSTVLLTHASQDKDVAVFEVDEFTLPQLTKHIKPSIVALLNLSRDQLDRHWETDIVFTKWKEALEKLETKPTILIDAEQKQFKELKFDFQFDDNNEALEHTQLLGSFNAKNVNCALKIVELLGVSRGTALPALADFDYAYGRGEVIKYKNKEFRVLLAKNPASLNQNLRTLIENPSLYDTLVFVLNDNIPDGHDVSWIYDINPNLLQQASEGKKVFVSGIRAYDMAIRLEYAGVSVISQDAHDSLKRVYNEVVVNEQAHSIVVLPNYSAMLETRKVLVGRRIL